MKITANSWEHWLIREAIEAIYQVRLKIIFEAFILSDFLQPGVANCLFSGNNAASKLFIFGFTFQTHWHFNVLYTAWFHYIVPLLLFQANTLLKNPTPSVSYNQLKKKSTLQKFKALKVVFLLFLKVNPGWFHWWDRKSTLFSKGVLLVLADGKCISKHLRPWSHRPTDLLAAIWQPSVTMEK